MHQQKFHGKFTEFSEKSMRWCAKQSEDSVEATTTILNILLQDASRVSKMSTDTLQAMDTFKKAISGTAKMEPDEKTKKIIGALKALSSQHLEISDFASPIIETLQFQDRIRQNMENLAKMTKAWMLQREMEVGDNASSADVLKNFGEVLIKCSTMKSERDVVRKSIAGMPEEQVTEDVMLF